MEYVSCGKELCANSILSSEAKNYQLNCSAKLKGVRSVGELGKVLADLVNDLGFTDYSFVGLDVPEQDSSPLITIPQNLLTEYFSSGFHEHDMIFPYLQSNTKPVYQSIIHSHFTKVPKEIACINPIRAMLEINNLNCSFGYHDFFNTVFEPYPGSGKTLFTVSIRGLSPDHFHQKVSGKEELLSALGDAVTNLAIQKFPGLFFKSENAISISPRRLEILNVLANYDVNIDQAADLLSISRNTASKHLHAARKSLGVRNTNHAIKKAIEFDLIDCKRKNNKWTP